MSEDRVYIMMSGGVDSSVAASLLLNKGYKVTGVYIKCWSLEQLDNIGVSRDLYACNWEDDLEDAKLVANKLGVEFLIWDFQKEYLDRVVNYMLKEYQVGRTPNPDVMCNAEIKFGIFLNRAFLLDGGYVATGHYARIIKYQSKSVIARGLDKNKDQSYFLWNVNPKYISKILFPIGEFSSKTEVRKYAQEKRLITANKKDSQGLCFVGKTSLRELLSQKLGVKEGEIINEESGEVLGIHPGAHLYTIGQREKLGLAGGPWFVSKIDIDQNKVYVIHENFINNLSATEILIKEVNLFTDLDYSKEYLAQTRYRQKPTKCQVKKANKNLIIKFISPVRSVAIGQSLVIYDSSVMIGGGIISECKNSNLTPYTQSRLLLPKI